MSYAFSPDLCSAYYQKAAATSGGGPGQVASLPPPMQADHLRKMVKSCKGFGKMTDLELDEVAVRGETCTVSGECIELMD